MADERNENEELNTEDLEKVVGGRRTRQAERPLRDAKRPYGDDMVDTSVEPMEDPPLGIK